MENEELPKWPDLRWLRSNAYLFEEATRPDRSRNGQIFRHVVIYGKRLSDVAREHDLTLERVRQIVLGYYRYKLGPDRGKERRDDGHWAQAQICAKR